MPRVPTAEVVKAATLMGYRRIANGKDAWGKPFGYSLLVISIVGDKARVEQWFTGANQQKCLYSSEELSNDVEQLGSLVVQIKEFETWKVQQVASGLTSTYEFLSPEQEAIALLEEE